MDFIQPVKIKWKKSMSSKIMWFPELVLICCFFFLFWVCFQLGLMTKFHQSHHILFFLTQLRHFFLDFFFFECKINLVMSIVRADGLPLCICRIRRIYFWEKGEKICDFIFVRSSIERVIKSHTVIWLTGCHWLCWL